MVNTKTAEFRQLRFTSFADVGRDLDGLEAAHRAGTLRQTGNWTPGQIFTHIAAFMNYAYDGYPPELSGPPWIVRFIMKFFKNRYLYKGMPRGVRIPGVPTGTVGADDVSFEEGAARVRAALARMDRTEPTRPNPLFGPMRHEEWKAMNTRHCELHMGYLHPR
ncbi:MAG: DUF1569 domain-containing protein [Phycisphaerales bacterium]|nr:DUF1569 domain-containing protein [Phycisphaerales bacterium]